MRTVGEGYLAQIALCSRPGHGSLNTQWSTLPKGRANPTGIYMTDPMTEYVPYYRCVPVCDTAPERWATLRMQLLRNDTLDRRPNAMAKPTHVLLLFVLRNCS